jgi:hypothetical protein
MIFISSENRIIIAKWFFCFIGKHVPRRVIYRSKKWKMEGSSDTGLLPTPAKPVFQYVSE